MNLYDRVYVKSQKTMGVIVDIIDDHYAVEKEGNAGPIYWYLPANDLIPSERLQEIEDIRDCLKSYRLHSIEFTRNGLKYVFVKKWYLIWEEDGQEKELVFPSKKAFREASVFNGKTIMEILDQLTNVEIDLDPEWPEAQFYQKEIKEMEENG